MYDKIKNLFEARGIKTEERIVYKDNVALRGLELHFADYDANPIIYPEDCSGSAEAFVEETLKEVKKNAKFMQNLDVDRLSKFENIKDKLRICLQPESKNGNLEKKPFKEDMEAYLRVFLSEEATFQVTNVMYTDVNRKELWRTAYENTLKSLNIQTLSAKLGFPDVDDGYPKTYVVTNEEATYGAGGIVCRDLLQEKFKGERLLILPSSIHECLVVVGANVDELDNYSAMVKDINQSSVAPEERLADHAFWY